MGSSDGPDPKAHLHAGYQFTPWLVTMQSTRAQDLHIPTCYSLIPKPKHLVYREFSVCRFVLFPFSIQLICDRCSLIVAGMLLHCVLRQNDIYLLEYSRIVTFIKGICAK